MVRRIVAPWLVDIRLIRKISGIALSMRGCELFVIGSLNANTAWVGELGIGLDKTVRIHYRSVPGSA